MQISAIRADGPVAVGLSNGPIVGPFLEWSGGGVDYVETAFEQLRFDPAAADVAPGLPVILHCSSMSVAGFVPPDEHTLRQIEDVAQAVSTPWIGEHLAFITADPLAGGDPIEDGSTDPVTLTYTVCPQLSEETIELVKQNLAVLRSRFREPIILENSPQYFDVPGSTMTPPQFLGQVADRCDVDLLLDLTHWMITANNTGTDPLASLEAVPLERVREVHLSGLSKQDGRWWDDHSVPVPEEVFDLLMKIADRVSPAAVTFEYNWAPSVHRDVLARQIARVREVFA
jgi:uncharacterized protein